MVPFKLTNRVITAQTKHKIHCMVYHSVVQLNSNSYTYTEAIVQKPEKSYSVTLFCPLTSLKQFGHEP